MFDWDDIKVFLAVSRSNTIRGAARSLGTTHATVARRLKTLESRLGSALFERHKDGHRLTEAGRSVMTIAEDTERQMGEIGRRAFGHDLRLAGTVRISVSVGLYLFILGRFMPRFAEQYPMLDIDIIATDQIINLAKRETDIAIRVTKNPPVSAVGRKLADSPLGVFASPAYLASRPALDRWVSLKYEPASRPVLPARVVARTNSAVVAQQMICDGLGIGLLPCFVGDNNPMLVRVPGTEPIADNEVWLLTHADIHKNRRVRVCVDFLYSLFGEMEAAISGGKAAGKASPVRYPLKVSA